MPRVVAIRLKARHCRANGDSEHMPLFTVSIQLRPTGSRVATAGIGTSNQDAGCFGLARPLRPPASEARAAFKSIVSEGRPVGATCAQRNEGPRS